MIIYRPCLKARSVLYGAIVEMGSEKKEIYNIQNTLNYQKWKKRRDKGYINCACLIFFLEAFLGILIFLYGSDYFSIIDIIFGVFGILVFLCLAFYFLYLRKKEENLKIVEQYWGSVISKSQFKQGQVPNKYKKKAFYVRIKVGDSIIEGMCSFEDYKRLVIGEGAWIFKVDENVKRYYVISNE